MSRDDQKDREFWAQGQDYLLSRDELRSRFGPLIDSVRDALSEHFATASDRQPVLTLKTLRFAFDRAMHLILPEIGFPVPVPALATRGMDKKTASAAAAALKGATHRAWAAGMRCRGELEVGEDSGGKARFTLALLDEQEQRIRPFFVTVRDANGAILRERVRFDAWEGTFSDVPLDAYTFRVEDAQGERWVEMGVEPHGRHG